MTAQHWTAGQDWAPGPACVVTGLLVFDPGLDVAETAYLTQFCESRRWDRPTGPYAVPGNPAAECLDAALDVDAFARPATGQPSLHCPWVPRADGRALHPRAAPATPDDVVAWLDYLHDHFFGPDARLLGQPPPAGLDGFAGFELHALTGAVAIADPVRGRLEAVLVRNGAISRRLLHPDVGAGLQWSA